jgi:DHA1 family tetracycline resistance protein-like MFS transporter
MLGAAFGVGFVLGPTTGGILGHYNHSLPAYFALVMSGGAGLLSWFMLPESRPKQPAEAEVWLHPRSFLPIFRQPILAQLLYISFFVMASFVMMESTAAVFLSRVFGWSTLRIGLFFGYLGVVIILIQGGLVGRLTKKVGEWKLTTVGPLLVAIGMVGFTISGFGRTHYNMVGATSGFVASVGIMLTLLALLAGGAINASGRSLQQPTMTSLMSQYSRPEEHGAVFGVYHGLGSLARVFGPLLAAPAFAIPWMHGTGQFAVAGVIALVMAWWTNKVRKQAGKPISGSDKELSVSATAGEAHGVTAEPA